MADPHADAGRLADELGVTPPGYHFEPQVRSQLSRVAPPPSPGATPPSEVQRYVDHLLSEVRAKQSYGQSLEVEVRRGRVEVAELHARVASLEAELDELRREHGNATAHLAATHHRMADIAHRRLQRMPWLLAALRRGGSMVRARRSAARAGSATTVE